MNDEIKEILDRLEYIVFNEIIDYGEELSLNECKLLLDYITNLQQAIKDTKDTADDMLYELKQENERLKEENNNKAMNDYVHAIDDYKSRCEKAIKYLEEAVEGLEEYHFDGYDPNLAYVISILKGDK